MSRQSFASPRSTGLAPRESRAAEVLSRKILAAPRCFAAMPPQPLRLLERIDLEPRPLVFLVAGVVQGPVMYVAQRHGPIRRWQNCASD